MFGRLTGSLAITITASLVLALFCACQDPLHRDSGPGVSWSLAQQRFQDLARIRYELSFAIPDANSGTIDGTLRLSFTDAGSADPLVLDFAQPRANVRTATVNGARAKIRVADEHIFISRANLRKGNNVVEISFATGESPLNRNSEYLYTLFVPDRARHAFPVFDQPNLKARYRLTLEIPASWTAVSNARLERRTEAGGRATLTFDETPPIPSYLFSFVAGQFQVESASRGKYRMRMFHRETDREKVVRNRDEIFDLHAEALSWLEQYTGIPYPFGKFDFVLIPSFQFNGMEHPGAILYRDTSVLLEETATQNQRLARASVIGHEAAHMWFGNLVTMNWFNDVWMKEVFANFMAAKIVHPSFPHVDHQLRFLLAHYPPAYRVDRTDGANPIRQDLSNLREAGTLYGEIIYQKAPIVMRQLEQLIGAEPMRTGLREYLATFKYGNADWMDLIDILDKRTEEDLKAWSRVWVDEPGRPTIKTSLESQDGKIRRLHITQQDPRRRGRVWNQSLEIVLGYEDRPERRFPIQLRSLDLPIEGAIGLDAPDYVVANGRGLGYGYFELDPETRTYFCENLPGESSLVTRAVAWISLWEEMLAGVIPPVEFFDLSLRYISSESNELIIDLALRYLRETYWRFLSEEDRSLVSERVERVLWQRSFEGNQRSLKSEFFSAFRKIALSEQALARLRRIWKKEERVPGLPLSERDFTDIALELAIRGGEGAGEILPRELAQIRNPDRRERLKFLMPALSSRASDRDQFFESLRDRSRRAHEPWVVDALRSLHHPLRARHAEAYIQPSLIMLSEIQRTGDIFFPKQWLDATLSGHSSERAAEIVRLFLAQGRGSSKRLSERLNEKLMQSADPLFRASRIKEGNFREKAE